MRIKNIATAGLLSTLLVTSVHAETLQASEPGAGERMAPARAAGPPRSAVLGSKLEEQRYAAREAAAPAAKNYRAGDVVVISATALVIILLVIIIIILI